MRLLDVWLLMSVEIGPICQPAAKLVSASGRYIASSEICGVSREAQKHMPAMNVTAPTPRPARKPRGFMSSAPATNPIVNQIAFTV